MTRAQQFTLSNQAERLMHAEAANTELKAEKARLRAALEAAHEQYRPLVDEVEKRLREYPSCFDLSVERGLREALAKVKGDK